MIPIYGNPPEEAATLFNPAHNSVQDSKHRLGQPFQRLPGRLAPGVPGHLALSFHLPWFWTAAFGAPAATILRAMPIRPLCPEKPCSARISTRWGGASSAGP